MGIVVALSLALLGAEGLIASPLVPVVLDNGNLAFDVEAVLALGEQAKTEHPEWADWDVGVCGLLSALVGPDAKIEYEAKEDRRWYEARFKSEGLQGVVRSFWVEEIGPPARQSVEFVVVRDLGKGRSVYFKGYEALTRSHLEVIVHGESRELNGLSSPRKPAASWRLDMHPNGLLYSRFNLGDGRQVEHEAKGLDEFLKLHGHVLTKSVKPFLEKYGFVAPPFTDP